MMIELRAVGIIDPPPVPLISLHDLVEWLTDVGCRDEAALEVHRQNPMMAKAPGTHQDWIVSRKVTRCTAD